MIRTCGFALSLVFLLFLTGCNALQLKSFYNDTRGLTGNKAKAEPSQSTTSFFVSKKKPIEYADLSDLVRKPKVSIDVDAGFKVSLKSAIEKDPEILSLKQSLAGKNAEISLIEAQKELQITGSLYGGIEDVSDQQNGVAAVINARKLLYDGGALDANIELKRFETESEKYLYRAAISSKLLDLASTWVDLELYRSLNEKIENRLLVLDPMIKQLEQVAEAGVADVSRVAAAQRTVALIRVAQTDVSERLAHAELRFVSSFGGLPKQRLYDDSFLSGLVPEEVTIDMAQRAPILKSQYADYKQAEANLAGVEAQYSFNLGLESRFSRPFGGSGYDSDESVGVVLQKDLLNRKSREAEIEVAKATLNASIEKIKSTTREGEKAIKTSKQTIKSMDAAIEVARKSAQATSDEIIYLRRQLVIGGSTLDNILSAEARLYDAESREVKFTAEKRKAELNILTTLGLLSRAIGL